MGDTRRWKCGVRNANSGRNKKSLGRRNGIGRHKKMEEEEEGRKDDYRERKENNGMKIQCVASCCSNHHLQCMGNVLTLLLWQFILVLLPFL